jgi:hypothetical protein
MLSTELEYLCTELECFLQGWNAFCRDGMLPAGLECFLQGWNDIDSVGIPLYTVGMLSTVLVYLCTELECSLEDWNVFDSVGIPLYRDGMLSTGLERLRQG